MGGSWTRCLAGLALFLQGSAPAPLPIVEPNDNRTPSGTFAGDSLVIALEVRKATWYPENPGGSHAEVAAFAESGRAPEIPGPLIRVKEGTWLVATLHNTLSDSSVTFRGFITRPAARDSGIRLAPGERRTVRFLAGSAGTYYYEANVGVQSLEVEREQLAGAFVVDPPGGSPADRIFVINIWSQPIDSLRSREALAINGRSWPFTERIGATVGDSLRWRVINPTVRPHPMHLHGVYFRQDSRGRMTADTAWNGDARQLIVTSAMLPGSTLAMVWRPDRPGNWLFHCHLMFHAVAEARLDPEPHGAHSGDPDRHMAGLVLGIQAAPRPGDPLEEARPNPRRMDLYVQEGARRHRADRSLGFVLAGARAPAPDSVEGHGSLLVLTRDQPTDIVVHNRLREPTAVHWHGIELESWSDGVPGWSGIGKRVAPVIAPGDSFTARLTLPRAGTFIYHTHLNDIEQIVSGLYGPIVVLEPGERFDPSRDHVFISGWDGDTGEPPRTLINGDSMPRTETLRAGVSHRFRFINIGPAGFIRYSIHSDTTTQSWRLLAKDGADVPESRRASRPAFIRVSVGETWDFSFEPPARGEYLLYWQFSGLVQGPRTLLRRYIVE